MEIVVRGKLWLTSFALIMMLSQSPHFTCIASQPIFIENGNIMLGSLFAIHRQGSTDGSCGKVNPITGIIFHEAFRYAIQQLNINRTILQGASLGHTTIDTCMSTIRLKNYLKGLILAYGGIGIVGPLTSDEAVYSSPVLSIFDVNMVSYHASSLDIDNRKRYDNMFRTVPSDTKQILAILDILKAMGWTYISTVNSNGNYGQRGMEKFTQLAKGRGICLRSQAILSVKPPRKEYESTVQTFKADFKVRVVVIITTASDTGGLLQAAKELNIERGRFIWIGSTAWGTELPLAQNFEKEADGAIILSYNTNNYPEFQSYLSGLRINNISSPWTLEFFETVFNCSKIPSSVVKNCTGKESLDKTIFTKYSIPVGLVFKAVNTFACAVNHIISQRCKGPEKNKTACILAPPSLLSAYHYDEKLLLRKLFSENGSHCPELPDSITFEADGSARGDFEILNFQRSTDKRRYDYVRVGSWTIEPPISGKNTTGLLTLDRQKIRWPGRFPFTQPNSTCSPQCKVDEIIKNDLSRPRCCWKCKKCKDVDLVVNKSICVPCPAFHFPNIHRTICKKLPTTGLSLYSPSIILIIVMSTCGIIGVIIVCFIFITQKKTRLVRASGRELSLLILAGIFLCFVAPLIFLSESGQIMCGLKRIITGISLTTCYTPLLLKTNRIYRIFTAAQKSIKRPMLVSPVSQIFICVAFFVFQLFLGLIWLISDPPQTKNVIVDSNTAIITICISNDSSLILYLVISLCLIVCCTYFAFRTRNFPKNYNEAKSIGITMYITCVLWGIFLPMYIFVKTDNEVFQRTLLTGIFLDILAVVTLSGLFGPKVYFLLMHGDIRSETATLYTQSDQYTTQGVKTAKIQPAAPCGCQERNSMTRTTSTSDLIN